MLGAYDSAETYKTQQIMTAPPEQLTLMLYNGAIRFINESIVAINENQVEKSHNANIRAQNIIRELMAALDMQYTVSTQLMTLYEYAEYRLQSTNLKKNAGQLEEVRDLITELRNTWSEVIKKYKRNATPTAQCVREAVCTIMSDALNRSIKELWRDYEFLTKEISRFIDARDGELVDELVSQRDKLETIIKEKNDQTFHMTPEGKVLIGSILALNSDAANRLQHHKLSQAYDGDSDLIHPTHYLDKNL